MPPFIGSSNEWATQNRRWTIFVFTARPSQFECNGSLVLFVARVHFAHKWMWSYRQFCMLDLLPSHSMSNIRERRKSLVRRSHSSGFAAPHRMHNSQFGCTIKWDMFGWWWRWPFLLHLIDDAAINARTHRRTQDTACSRLPLYVISGAHIEVWEREISVILTPSMLLYFYLGLFLSFLSLIVELWQVGLSVSRCIFPFFSLPPSIVEWCQGKKSFRLPQFRISPW